MYILEKKKLVFSQINTHSLGPGVEDTDVTASKKSYLQQETRMGWLALRTRSGSRALNTR